MNDQLPVPVFIPPQIGGYIENPTGYRYKVIKGLNSGAFGSVFLGYDIFDVPYAIKVFRPSGTYEIKEMWNEEAKKLRALFHPYIAYMHDVFEYKSAFFIVMELLGQPVRNLIKDGKTVNDDTIIEIARQILFGMSFIHWHNIVHRDLSLDNILLTQDDKHVKITDFGVSKNFEPLNAEKKPEPPFNPLIICPDLLLSGVMTPQSDLYHLGLILLTLKIGKDPIAPNLPQEEIKRLCSEGAPRIIAEGLSCPLGDKIARLLRRRAEYRYTSAMDAWNDLKTLKNQRLFD